MTAQQRRLLVAICIIVGVTFMVSAGLTFLITPMADDLGLSPEQVDRVLGLPGIGSLLIIFVAGRLGDTLGHRSVIVWAGIGFSLGAAALAAAGGAALVSIGLFVCGATATVVQVVALGLLQISAPDGKAHTSAFTTYGMVFPVAYLVFPLTTSGLLGIAQWRIVPIVWVLGGVLLVLVALRWLDRPVHRSATGEMWTPILAGVALAALLRWFGWVQVDGFMHPRASGTFILGLVSLFVLVLVLRRRPSSSLSVRVLREPSMLVLLIGVAAVALVATLTFITLAIEAMYGLSAIDAAVVLVPAQISAIIGAKVLALWMMRRWGIGAASRILVTLLGLGSLLLFGVRPDSSVWYLVVCAVLINGFGLAAVTTLNTDVMGRAEPGEASAVSAFRGAASSIGATLAVYILGGGVVEAIGVDEQAVSNSVVDLDAIASALRFDGVISFIFMLATLALLVFTARRSAHAATAGAA